jgi:nitrogen fixation NifU-like protein
MSDLMDLYQELILDHNKRPRNRGRLDEANHEAEGYNPLCGDRVTITVLVRDGVIEDVRFEGTGCAISTASASLMSEAIKGRTVEEAEALFRRFHGLVAGEEANGGPPLGKLEAFAGVSRFPARVKCATLAWHTLTAALQDRDEPISTE